MDCPNCQEPVEPAAKFCGNCGQPLKWSRSSVAIAREAALANPARLGENQAVLSVLLGAAGLAGAAFMAVFGLGLGLAGLVLGSLSLSKAKHKLNVAGVILSALAVVAGLAVWTYAVNHDKTVQASMAASRTADNLSTACYSLGFANKLNVSQAGCDMRAYNGPDLGNSTEAYKVYANQTSLQDAASFTRQAKQALEKDVKTSLAGYSIVSEGVGAFAGSPDYQVVATDKIHGVSVAEAAVYHPVKTGDNVFILVHAMAGQSANFTTLEAEWQWK